MEGERRSGGFGGERRSGGFGGNRGGGFNRGGGRGGFGGNRGGFRRSFNDGPREMHKAICSECKKECEVPFKPTEGKPVYCKECYFKRKDGGSSFGDRRPAAKQETSQEGAEDDFESSQSDGE